MCYEVCILRHAVTSWSLVRIRTRIGAPCVNVILELSRLMLDLTERHRTLQLSRLLSEVISAYSTDVVLLDNIEVLFDISLKQDLLWLLQGVEEQNNKSVLRQRAEKREPGLSNTEICRITRFDHAQVRRLMAELVP
jgi:hypothetical protein